MIMTISRVMQQSFTEKLIFSQAMSPPFVKPDSLLPAVRYFLSQMNPIHTHAQNIFLDFL
jgi:hypothetical protein